MKSNNLPIFKQLQNNFSQYIRDPLNNPAPLGIESRRLKVYTELFYNNIEGFIANGFPILRSLTSDEDWHKTVRAFMKYHQCQTPYFLQISEEFLEFLTSDIVVPIKNFPFLLELAHYEWVELALMVSPENNTLQDVKSGEEMETVWQVSPLAWHLAYAFDVQNIGDEYIPEHAPQSPTFLVVYRKQDDEVAFMAINAVTYRLLELIQEKNTSALNEILVVLLEELNHPNPDVVKEGAINLLKDLQAKGIVGTQEVGLNKSS
ncbi:MAG: putative DNA-binding domain-containing protein [Pseudomonadota bacterium]